MPFGYNVIYQGLPKEDIPQNIAGLFSDDIAEIKITRVREKHYSVQSLSPLYYPSPFYGHFLRGPHALSDLAQLVTDEFSNCYPKEIRIVKSQKEGQLLEDAVYMVFCKP